MSKTVSAIFTNHESAKRAIKMLHTKGFHDKDLSVLASQGSFDQNIAIEKNTKAPEGIATGATLGATAGAIAAGLTAVGTVTLTGGLGLLAAGPVVAAFAGAGAGAATGGVIGGLVGMGIPETEAKFIENNLEKGHVMLGVHVPDNRENDVKDFLENSNAEKVSTY